MRKQTKNFKSGGKKEYVPSVKDGFNAFLLSLYNLPFATLRSTTIVDKDNLLRVLEAKDELSLNDVIRAAVNVFADDQVEDALAGLYPDDENSDRMITYAIDRFDKLNDRNPNVNYKQAGEDFITLVKGMLA